VDSIITEPVSLYLLLKLKLSLGISYFYYNIRPWFVLRVYVVINIRNSTQSHQQMNKVENSSYLSIISTRSNWRFS